MKTNRNDGEPTKTMVVEANDNALRRIEVRKEKSTIQTMGPVEAPNLQYTKQGPTFPTYDQASCQTGPGSVTWRTGRPPRLSAARRILARALACLRIKGALTFGHVCIYLYEIYIYICVYTMPGDESQNQGVDHKPFQWPFSPKGWQAAGYFCPKFRGVGQRPPTTIQQF